MPRVKLLGIPIILLSTSLCQCQYPSSCCKAVNQTFYYLVHKISTTRSAGWTAYDGIIGFELASHSCFLGKRIHASKRLPANSHLQFASLFSSPAPPGLKRVTTFVVNHDSEFNVNRRVGHQTYSWSTSKNWSNSNYACRLTRRFIAHQAHGK